MPETAMTSCIIPASAFAAGAVGAAAFTATTAPLDVDLAPEDDSHSAVSLLKNSDEACRLLGTCLVRAMFFFPTVGGRSVGR